MNEKILQLCSFCKDDKNIFCPRNVDAKCLICGQCFCGGHIGVHLKKAHNNSWVVRGEVK